MKPVVLVDLDGVVIDLHGEWLRRYNRDFDDALTSEDVTGWDLHLHVKPEGIGSIYNYLHDADLYDHCDPVPGALDGLAVLKRKGFGVLFLTSCVSVSMISGKVRWLDRHGLAERAESKKEIPDNLIAASVKGRAFRGVALIDDRLENLAGFGHAGGLPLLFSAPWNADVDDRREGVVRVTGWPSVVEVLTA